MKLSRIFIGWLFVLSCISGHAIKTLQKVDIRDLSNNAVLYMHQDRHGDMWFGTYDGLNLYNGAANKVYRYESGNEYSINGNIIRKIIDGGDDYIWVSNLIGVNRISLKERKVTASYLEYRDTHLLAADSSGNTILISLDDFVSCYTIENERFIDVYAPGVSKNTVHELFVFENKFYIITKDGLLKQIELITQTLPATIQLHTASLHYCDIMHASYDNGVIYFIDITNKLYSYDCMRQEKQYIADLSILLQKNGTVISKILSWNSDIYIAFMSHGLVKLDKNAKDGFVSILAEMGVFSLSKDRKQDILWLGTDGSGVFMYYEKQEVFTHLMQSELPYFSQKPIRAIYTDEANGLWVGTKGNGIYYMPDYDSKKSTLLTKEDVVHYTANDGLSNDQVFCFQRSKYRDDILWIGTQGPGLSYYSYKKNKIYTLPQKKTINIGLVHAICEVNDSVLWVATSGSGLLEVIIKEEGDFLVIENTESYTVEKNGRQIREFYSMIYDEKSTLYAGSRGGDGVVRFNLETKTYDFLLLEHEERSSAIGDVLCVHLAADGTLYFGASSGLTKIVFNTEHNYEVKQFDRRDGIANDMIHCILEDNSGCLWLSTNRGLTKYNPKNNFFHNYTSPDLQVTEFSDDAYWKCPRTNRLFFGGVNGLVWLSADINDPIDYLPVLRFRDLSMNGYNYPIVEPAEKLTIPAKTSFFTISFVATDYIHGDNYEYSYFIEGYSNTWFELQKKNEITFINLPVGEYILRVKYKNDVYDSSAKEYTLPLVVLPPWYWSKWAIVVYVLLGLLLLYTAFRLIRTRIRRQQHEVTKRIKEEQKQKAYESKLNFFTNITHELFTPLTLINGIAGSLHVEMDDKEAFEKQISLLKSNVNNLNELIQEIVDFRKVEEEGTIRPVIKNVQLSELMHIQSDLFQPVASENNIRFELDIPEQLFWATDKSSFKKIFTNLVSNAFKYAKEEGVVRVTAAIENDLFVLKVYNTGVGIEASKISRVFDRYRILEHMEENKYMQMTARNGLGLFICHTLVKSLNGDIRVESEVNRYTEVTVTLPKMAGLPVSEENVAPVIKVDGDMSFVEDKAHVKADRPVVLVVDDNKDIVWFVSQALSELYEVRKAYNATEALHIIEKQQPALIITDIIMPQMDGLEFIRQVKKDKFTKHIPIVIVSAKITDQEQAEGLDLGADAYLTKPFSPVVLLSVVNRLLASKSELKDYYYSPESAFEYKEGNVMHKEDKEFIDKVVQSIRNNIEKENLRPELIAEELGLNTRNLYRKVKKISSLPPSDFIKDYRFTYAAQLLISTNLNIQEIIYKVGITNKSYFYREFYKKYQMTPKEYRQQK